MATKRNTYFQDPDANEVELFKDNPPDTSSLVDRVLLLNEQWEQLGLDEVYGDISSIEPDLDLPARVNKIETIVRRSKESI
jgi:hypothetical protein